MQPNLHPPIFIHANQVLRHLEIPNTLVQLLEPFKRTEQHIQVLRIWDILNIAKPNRNVLDVNLGTVVGVAKFLAELVIEVFGVDDVVLPLPPLKELQIFLELCQVVKGDNVLLKLLVGEVVY